MAGARIILLAALAVVVIYDIGVTGAKEESCNDGVQTKDWSKGSFKFGKNCKNKVSFTEYFCIGKCPGREVCLTKYGPTQDIPMEDNNGRPCEPYVNEVIRECKCGRLKDEKPTTKPTCKSEKKSYSRRTYSIELDDGRICSNTYTFTRYFCRGGCNEGEKCRGTTKRQTVKFTCDPVADTGATGATGAKNKKKTKIIRVFPKTTRCKCNEC